MKGHWQFKKLGYNLLVVDETPLFMEIWWKMKNNENNITMSPDEAEFIELLMKHPELHDKLKEILS